MTARHMNTGFMAPNVIATAWIINNKRGLPPVLSHNIAAILLVAPLPCHIGFIQNAVTLCQRLKRKGA